MGRDPQQIRNMSVISGHPLFVPTLARKPSSNMAFLVSDKAEVGENFGGVLCRHLCHTFLLFSLVGMILME